MECLFRTGNHKGLGWRCIKSKLAEIGGCRSILIELNKNHQIDWYLQAELAYNKRFGESGSKDQKNKAKRIRFMQYRVLSFDEITLLIKSKRYS